MVNLVRKYQQPALICITVLVIISFVLYWNGSQGGRGGLGGGPGAVARIYGRDISAADIQRDVKRFQIAEGIGLQELVQVLAGNAQNRQDEVENFVWNWYVLQQEADRLQIYPTDAQAQEELTQAPLFQTDGHFDPVKMTNFVQNQLGAMGFSDSVLDELVRAQARVKLLAKVIGSTADITPSEVENRYTQGYEKIDVSFIRLTGSDVERGIAVTDAEARKAYDDHKDSYHSDEQRKVTIASFELTEAQKALKGRERTEALQKLGGDAWNFAQAVVDKGADFAGKAAAAGARLTTTGFFSAEAPDPAMAKVAAMAPNAFKLSTDLPASDVVEGQNGYYVIHLEGIMPSKPLTFDEARPKVVAAIQKERAVQVLRSKATEVRMRLAGGLGAGLSFDQAATAAGVTPIKVPTFTLADIAKMDVPDAQRIVEAAIQLPPHQLSDFIPTEAGVLLLYVANRTPPSKAEMDKAHDQAEIGFNRQQHIFAVVEWLRIQKNSAKLQFLQHS